MTLNGYISFLMQSLLAKEPLLTTKEVEELYQSNAQLLRIGLNINQIAKSLNTNNSTALNTQELKEIKAQITQHTDSLSGEKYEYYLQPR